jgi:hypothetical protein
MDKLCFHFYKKALTLEEKEEPKQLKINRPFELKNEGPRVSKPIPPRPFIKRNCDHTTRTFTTTSGIMDD